MRTGEQISTKMILGKAAETESRSSTCMLYGLRAIISEKAWRISRPGDSFSIAMKTNTSGVTSILAAEVLGVSSNELSPRRWE